MHIQTSSGAPDTPSFFQTFGIANALRFPYLLFISRIVNDFVSRQFLRKDVFS